MSITIAMSAILCVVATSIVVGSRRRPLVAKAMISVLSATMAVGVVTAGVANAATKSQHPLTISNKVHTGTVGTSLKVTVSGGSGKGALKFSASGADCHIVATTGVLKATAATTCAVKVTKAASKGYRSATSPVVKFVFSLPKGSLAISNSVLQGEVGVPLTVTAKGGFGTGAVTFDTNGAVCSINPVSGALVAGAVGTCPVTATKAASGSYPAQTSAPVTFTFGPGPQSTLAISNSELVGQVGTNLTVVTSGGSGTGALSFSVTGTGCSIVAATGVLSDTQAGTCAVTAHKAASTSYLAATAARTASEPEWL